MEINLFVISNQESSKSSRIYITNLFCASIRQRELVLSFMINFRWIKLILITLEFDIRSEQVALDWKTLTREVVRNGMDYRRG